MIYPKISIVIGTLDRPHVVTSLINQLKNIPSIEVLVIDQSDAKNYEQLKKGFPKKPNFFLYHLDQPSCVEFLNFGWNKANAPIVLYLDDDVEITGKTINSHLRAYENPEIKAVAGRVINDNELVKPDERRVGKIEWFGAVMHKNFSSKIKMNADFPYGCNMSYRKEVLEEIGGFDRDLQPPVQSYNEVDIGYRINKRWSRSLLFQHDALVYHHRYPSGGGRSYDSKTLDLSSAFNYGYFIGKNFTFLENLLWFLRRIPFQIMKEPGQIISILNGFLSGKKKQIDLVSLGVFLVFCFAFFLRFWKVPELFFFGIDEEYQSLLALSIIKDFHIIWIGLSAANTGFYIGPGLVYLHSLLLWFWQLDPIVLGYAASAISFIMVILFYSIIKHLFERKVALITTIIYSFSSFVMNYDRRFWNSTFVPVTAILFFLSLVKSEKNPRWYILAAILLGLSFHIHASLFIFIPIVIGVLLYRIFIVKQKIPIIYHLSSIISFLFIYSPLIVFDFVHNFDNLKTPFRMIQEMGKGKGSLSLFSHFQTTQSTLLAFWSRELFPPLVSYSLLFLFMVISLWFLLKKKNRVEKILLVILTWYMFMFVFYPGAILDYYFIGFFPFFAIVLALFFKEFYPISLIAIVILFAFPNMTQFLLSPTDQGLKAKKKLVQQTIQALGNSSFYLETDHNYLFFGGWRYLFEAYGKKPISSQADQTFGWIYQKEISDKKPDLKVTITDKPTLNGNANPVINSGIYYAIIESNK